MCPCGCPGLPISGLITSTSVCSALRHVTSSICYVCKSQQRDNCVFAGLRLSEGLSCAWLLSKSGMCSTKGIYSSVSVLCPLECGFEGSEAVPCLFRTYSVLRWCLVSDGKSALQEESSFENSALMEVGASSVDPDSWEESGTSSSAGRWTFFTNMTVQGDSFGNATAYSAHNNTHTLLSGVSLYPCARLLFCRFC